MAIKQTKLVYDYMREFGSISPLEAMRDLGVYRLASRISDLKREGVRIRTTTSTALNRWGKTSRFSEYSLEEENKQ